MKTLIVPTDFSLCSSQALSYAIGFANSLREQVHIALLHVLGSPIYSTDLPLAEAWDFLDQQKKESAALLHQLVEKHKSDSAMATFSTHVRTGLLLEQTESLVNESQADLVIMGTVGASGFFDSLLGSNANTLVKGLDCDVLVVPPGIAFAIPKTIVFAADLDRENQLELRKTVQLATRFNSGIVVVHAEEPEADVQTRVMSQLWGKLQNAADYPKLEFVTTYGQSIEECLLEVIEKKEADLLVMNPRNESLWAALLHRSHTKTMILQPHIATLCIKNHKANWLPIGQAADSPQTQPHTR